MYGIMKRRERLKGVYIRAKKKKVNKQFGKKMNEMVKGNRILFWEVVSNVKEERDRVAAE